MLKENTPYTHVVEFTSGSPSGVFSYSVYDGDGMIVDNLEDVVVPLGVGAISARINIPASANAITKPLFEKRLITWSYPVNSGTVNDSVSYTVQRTVPFPVTEEGVRTLLGVTEKEIPDERINLLGAYINFRETFNDPTDVDPFVSSGDLTAFKITRAIEAIAALDVLPTLQIALAKRFDSGTNSYERWNKIDWEVLSANLEQMVNEAILIIEPTFGFEVIPIFMLSTRVDPLTGA